MESLGEEFPKAQERARTMLGYYKEIGPVGQFGVMMIEDCLRRADKAVMEQDLPSMLKIYQELLEIE